MGRNRKIDLVLSVAVAIVLWMYVVGNMNPDMRKSFRNVPITFTNTQTLADNGLAVFSVSAEKLSVTVVGKRSRVSRLDDKDIKAVVDLSGAGDGKNTLDIELTTPQGVEISRQDIKSVEVSVEKLVSVQKKIQVSYLGTYPNDQEPTTLSMDPESVTVSGPASVVKNVSHVRATVKKTLDLEEKTVSTATLAPVDDSGKDVEGVALSQDYTDVTSVLYKLKTVPLNVTVKGADAGGYERTVDAPDSITVKGPSGILDSLKEIKAKDIDISGMTESGTVEIEPVFPEKVLPLAAAEKLQISVDVHSKEDQVKELQFSGGDIALGDIDSGLQASVETETVLVTLRGDEEALRDLEKSDVKLSAALKGLKEGTHSVPVLVTANVKGVSWEISPDTVTVKIVKAGASEDAA